MTEQHKPQSIEEILQDQRKWHEHVVDWFRAEGNSWALSLALHLFVLLIFGLIFGRTIYHKIVGDAPTFDAASIDTTVPPVERFEIGDAPLDPTQLSPETLNLPPAGQTALYYDDNKTFVEQGGGSTAGKDNGAAGMGLDSPLIGMGPVLVGGGGAETGKGTSTDAGRGGAGSGFAFRGQGHRDAIAGGQTPGSDRAVAGGLNWLARHQNVDGSWSTAHFDRRCHDGRCTGEGTVDAVFGGTALGLLPFLATGQTHVRKGPYQEQVKKAVNWLVHNQQPTGELFDLSTSSYAMYEQGMATIALCEIYGMTGDSLLRDPAQKAVEFIEKSQNREGGWRYFPGINDSDTSVFGWQMMAMKSAMMAGLKVDQEVMHKGQQWLMKSAYVGVSDPAMAGQFKYVPTWAPAPSMTGVGLLITQYMGANRDDQVLASGVKYLMANLPSMKERSIYYWYHATQVMHNMQGSDWDAWNRHTRRILIESQCKDGCASGSWDPQKPEEDAYGMQGGRLMLTSLSTLTLEVYYRYLPLYRVDGSAPPENAKEPK